MDVEETCSLTRTKDASKLVLEDMKYSGETKKEVDEVDVVFLLDDRVSRLP
jgi:hypothetical protein